MFFLALCCLQSPIMEFHIEVNVCIWVIDFIFNIFVFCIKFVIFGVTCAASEKVENSRIKSIVKPRTICKEIAYRWPHVSISTAMSKRCDQITVKWEMETRAFAAHLEDFTDIQSIVSLKVYNLVKQVTLLCLIDSSIWVSSTGLAERWSRSKWRWPGTRTWQCWWRVPVVYWDGG